MAASKGNHDSNSNNKGQLVILVEVVLDRCWTLGSDLEGCKV